MLRRVAKKLGVPDRVRSCHTAVIGGYFVEGHVPAADIRKLLRERPKARGIAVPGMPIGSPGMEQGDRRDAYRHAACHARWLDASLREAQPGQLAG